jgi:hypothetical protein
VRFGRVGPVLHQGWSPLCFHGCRGHGPRTFVSRRGWDGDHPARRDSGADGCCRAHRVVGDALDVADAGTARADPAVRGSPEPVRSRASRGGSPRVPGHRGAGAGGRDRAFRGVRRRPAGAVDRACGRGAVVVRARGGGGGTRRSGAARSGHRDAAARPLRGFDLSAPRRARRRGVREPAAVPRRGAAGGAAAGARWIAVAGTDTIRPHQRTGGT